MVAHPTLLLGPTFGLPRPGALDRAAVAEPWLLRLTGSNLVAHLLAELADPTGRDRLARARLRPTAERPVVVLEQPVHRSLNLVLVEARCLVPGLPRVDPQRIQSAGLVVRRLVRGVEQAWLREGTAALGWRTAPAGSLLEGSDWEPEAGRRRERARARRGATTARLLDQLPGPADATLSEATSPLFPVPNALAKALGSTLLYGLLPVTSAEQTAGAAPVQLSRADIASRVPALLRPDRDPDQLPPTGIEVGRANGRPELRTLVEALTWLAQETGLLTGGPEVAGLATALNAWPLVLPGAASTTEALAFLYRNLLGRPDPGFTTLRLPAAWPPVGQDLLERIVTGAEAAIRARSGQVAAGEGRFELSGARYLVRCFARLAPERPGCPLGIVWSAPTAPFRIKAWHEGSDQPPVQVELPSLARLPGVRPDIAFKVAPDLQRFMDRLNLQGLLDGSAAPREGGISFGMICSFSIPILTLCAFIVLQIFLVLLNLVFFWLPFVRICLPVPVPTDEEG